MKQQIILSGGLGNQMFQYAFYLSLKEKGISCAIDDTLFYMQQMHNGFELKKIFEIPETAQERSVIHKFWIRLLRRYKPTSFMFCDRAYQYCEDVYKTHKTYLMGDWLSFKYFDSIQSKICSIYRFHDISNRNLTMIAEMQAVNSVSLHIRRGDYLKLSNYCVCDEHYYTLAIKEILNRASNPVFYVFSNELSWCDEFMKKFNVNFSIVDWNQGKDSYQDMYLMTQCKHNIIANSTFSWWGAWLNQNVDKIVVSPKKWFKNSDYNINYPGWVLI